MRRSKGITLIEVLVALAVIGIISLILVPRVICYLEKGRIARSLTDIRQAGIIIEQYRIDTSIPPDTLQQAYDHAGAQIPPGLVYCSGYYSDPNSGHGNDCDFDDEDNPGQSAPGGDTAGLRYILRTDGDLGTACTGVDFIWCKGDPTPSVVKIGEWNGKLPGRGIKEQG